MKARRVEPSDLQETLEERNEDNFRRRYARQHRLCYVASDYMVQLCQYFLGRSLRLSSWCDGNGGALPMTNGTRLIAKTRSGAFLHGYALGLATALLLVVAILAFSHT